MKAMVKLKPQILFDLLILLFFVFLVWEASEWKLQARLYSGWLLHPSIIVILLMILTTLGYSIFKAKQRKESASSN